MTAREILTLQFGHYANYVGTHWWNLQEQSFTYNTNSTSEINHDVLYREGLSNKGDVTFTPRLLLVDLKGSLKSLPEHGNLYEEPVEPAKLPIAWESPPEIKKQAVEVKSSYLEELDGNASGGQVKLEDDVQVWSDFLYTRFHPRTVNVIREYEFESEDTPFNVFPLEGSLWNSGQFQDDYCDKVRSYVEESDCFQGFQILFDSTNAFSGLATSCMQYLQDEYECKSIFALPLIQSHFKEMEKQIDIINDSTRVLNLGLCYASLMENSSLFVPMCTGESGWRQPGAARKFNHINYNDELMYHSSAILASALDTFSLNYRLKQTGYALSNLAMDLTPHGRKAVAASLCLPFSLNQGVDLIDCLDNWDGPLTQSITPNCKIGMSRMMQLITLRGVSESQLKRPIQQAGKQKDMAAYRCKNIKEMLEMYYAYSCHASAVNVTSVSQPLKVVKPFPEIFDDRIGFNGNVIADRRDEKVGVDSVPVLAGLHTGCEIGDMLENLHTEMKKIKHARFHHFSSAGMEKDDFTECLDKLFDFRECYEDNYLV